MMDILRGTLRVLFVEDSEVDAALTLHELDENGINVASRRVETEATLRKALEEGPWDLIICDHNMPQLDSISALEIVKESRLDIPVVIVSGEIPDETAVAAMRAGAADFIKKDNLVRLAPVIERELREAAARADLRAAHASIEHLVFYDTLTGLPNRDHLFKYLGALVGQEQGKKSIAVLLVDLNRFRQITRTLGILIGNKVLQEVGERLRGALGEDAFVARLGADGFAVVVSDAGNESRIASAVAAIQNAFLKAFEIGGHELFLGCSIGGSRYPIDGHQPDQLYKNAEIALYSAKAAGMGEYRLYRREMSAGHESLFSMGNALHRALSQNEFLLHYQPQFDLYSGAIIGMEALLRWQNAEHGLVSPAQFIPLLEETGLIVPVGEWVLRTACATARAWQDAGIGPIRVAVNLSAIQFQQPDVVGTIRNILKESGTDPSWLELEITENIAMHNEEVTIATLTELKALGIGLAIDDFGTGYSSLSYLRRFPIHKLKIDRSFVSNIDSGQHADGAIVQAIIALGRGLGLKVIAEGVETEAQSSFLNLYGCDEVQGYLFSRPLTVEDATTLLNGRC